MKPIGRRAELLVVTSVLVLVGALAYGSYIAHGGFYADDWSNLADYTLGHGVRYWAEVSKLHHQLGGRPVQALLLPIPDALFGTDATAHLALAVVLAILTSLSIYALLRTLSMAPWHAGAIATLALLFPWSDSVHLWSAGSSAGVSVALLCLAVTVAIRGLERPGRAGLAQHAGAALLYVLSVLTYEATGAAALLAGFLYLHRAPRRVAVRRWAADVVVVLAALVYSLASTVTARHVGTLSQRITDLPHFIRQAALLFAAALAPIGRQSVPVQALLLLAVAAVAVLALIRVRRRSHAPVAQWVRWGVGAFVALCAAYFMFLGSQLHPLDDGIDNRTNVLAGPILCLFVYAVLAAAATLTFRSARAATLATLSVAALIAVGYAVHLHDDEANWRRAAALQHVVLDALTRHLPELPAGSTLVSFDARGQGASEVPVFNSNFDLAGALQLRDRDPSLSAYPVFPGVTVHCRQNGIAITGPADYGTAAVSYRNLYFLDVARASGRRIPSQAACLSSPHTSR